MSTDNLKDKTLFITGASRGIGKAIALRAARDGANIVLFAKTTEPHPKLPGTIYTAAEEIREAGGSALPCVGDIRYEEQLQAAVDKAVETFGGIDILINNASAISLTGTEATTMKSYDLMHQINSRGTFMASKLCLPHLKKAANPHILNLAPPLNMAPHWFGRHVAYTMAKYGMSLCVLGMADEYAGKVAINALWPKTVINTAAVQNQLGGAPTVKAARQPSIMADAAWTILTQPVDAASGRFFIDEDVLRSAGVNDLSGYRVDPDLDDDKLLPDFFLD
ncbi:MULTISPECIES: NAD(P)-dependent oxidoreductase [unclassified Alcanivorax]|jgi:citronellol/citronellal dehydrogenase|uniref:SDR family oxidoreductase n=1 Tax=unclassified Alcanivorax TaxID=2638842 RepID=UPI0008A03D5E|nr:MULTISPECIES: NAD(P)-dependent oxidoreductase [unclassified Alcanivorax]MED5239546.1 NAD(P)-dependent oxidoreductase [Pseudomonadota bacterium]MBB10752.1 short chain dehydrogenase [Alcanivorax sp.]MBU86174.1 short chain dehydrogenase [Alcanivorax sp.]MEE3389135.1 NAD(P)-dependent oxidoreductase [Pseudomonadota bacterium]SEG21319.1 citronellol/citronellal dehydrogenase [Alcanivorax sp. DSM 26293]|tara:strand:- start:467 stop:1303 length:837 start_codon:yes stop_codon:yes gene_type:complete